MTDIGRPPPPPPMPAPARARDASPTRKAEKAAPAKKGGAAQKAEAKDARAEVNSDGFSRGGVGGASGISTNVASGPHAFVRFGAAGEGVLDGELRQGGRVTVEYNPARVAGVDVARLPPGSLSITAFIRFGPRTDVVERPCVAYAVVRGVPGPARPSPVTLEIPSHAQSMEVWFRHVVKGPRPVDAQDGSSAVPHAYPVKPPLGPPRPLG